MFVIPLILGSVARADIGSILILLLGTPSMIAVINALGSWLKSRHSSSTEVEIKSSSGDATVIEIKKNMSTEETKRVVQLLHDFAKQSQDT